MSRWALQMVGMAFLLSCLVPSMAWTASRLPLTLTHVPAHEAKVRVDGRLDEAVWGRLPQQTDFAVVTPDTMEKPPYATRLRLFHTERGLYVGVDVDQPAETIIQRLTGRDVSVDERDSIGIMLDTSGQARYGYWFELALGDTLNDGTMLPEQRFSREWDGPWRGATTRTATGWSAEMMIPWNILAMPHAEGSRQIGAYVIRRVGHKLARWGWPPLPFTSPTFMTDMQPLIVEGVDPRQQYEVYPYVSASRDRIEGKSRYNAGVDVFWRPSTNFQLTGTLNPDFGAVESDDVVINLSATETFFPEKRLFFVEGQQIFVATPRAQIDGRPVGMSGAPYTMVNTRRIGGRPMAPELAAGVDVSERERIQPVDLLGAVKMTGQFGQFRYGAMAAVEDDVRFNATTDAGADLKLKEPGTDYGVARLLWEDNSGGATRGLGILSTAVLNPRRDALAHGLDWHYLTANGKWKVDGQAFTSDIDGEAQGYGGFTDLEYTYRRGMTQRVGVEVMDRNVDLNDLGFLSRNNYYQLRSAFSRIDSNLGWARDNEFDIRGFLRRNLDGLHIGSGLFISNRLYLNNLGRLLARAHFFPKHYDDLNSFGNGTYRVEERVEALFEYASDASQPLSWSLGGGFAEEGLGGHSFHVKAGLSWQPNDRLSGRLSLRRDDRDGWLLHQGADRFATFAADQLQATVSLDYFLTARQQFRASLQWVGVKATEQRFLRIPATPGDLIPGPRPADLAAFDFSVSQMALQVRYRWQLAPLSDLFVVYTRFADQARRLDDAGFGDLLEDAFDEPLGDLFVVKLRYRLGS
ncbi:MAG: hypothetical protein F4149_05460 [Gammaproteobacteria bacterium]|nr:hypothetical protein [Gammaproteobacteria bacterium]